MADDAERPIIIKKIKKGGHGHHGGAWKVAYADFVTAMMAFFLLLWLLSATTEEQKKGIADYFTPTIGVAGEKGIGIEGGKTPTEDGTSKSDMTPPGVVFGAPPTGPIVKDPEEVKKDYEAESEAMKELETQLKNAISKDPGLGKFQDNLLIEQTPEGLRIQLVDQDKKPMFEAGSYILTSDAKEILKVLSPVLQQMPNRVSISGHTDSSNYGVNKAYTNWELSADRANATRRFLMNLNMPTNKIVVVSGKADMEPLLPNDRANPRNRRISLVLLHKNIYPYDVPATEELLDPALGNDKPAAVPAEAPAPAGEKPADESVVPQNAEGAKGEQPPGETKAE
ncbi:flagellar motor protein MotB [bacterium]|nr:flagellar motor protein MotB [bacterium]